MILPTSHGYSFSIEALDHRHIELTASKAAGFVTYTALGHANSDRVQADFGRFGRISIRLHLRGVAVPLQLHGCKGGPTVVAGGGFEGMVAFKGDGDVPPVSAHRGNHIFFERNSKRICKRGKHRPDAGRESGDEGRGEELEELTALTRSRGRSVLFDEITLRDPRINLSISVSAGFVEERLGRVRISREAFELGDESPLVLSEPGSNPETATVTLPTPFSGTGVFSQSPPAPATWTGDLAVRLPGPGQVPLAGPKFRVKFCREKSIEQLNACLGDNFRSAAMARAERYLLRQHLGGASTLRAAAPTPSPWRWPGSPR